MTQPEKSIEIKGTTRSNPSTANPDKKNEKPPQKEEELGEEDVELKIKLNY